MDDNPYASPRTQSPAIGVLSGSREDLRNVAKYQKGILICILVYFIAVIFQFALPEELRLFLAFGVLVLGITAAIFVFRLAVRVYGTGAGIFWGILSFIPVVGLLALLLINGKATGILKSNGIKVGLLGADLSQI